MATPKGPYVPIPLDREILRLLPDEGTMFMSVYPEGPSVKNLQKLIAEGKISTTIISSRLRLMRQYGHVVKVQVPRQETMGWQATPNGRALFPDAEATDVSAT